MKNVDEIGQEIFNRIGEKTVGLSFHDRLCLNDEFVDEPASNVNAPWSRILVYLSSQGRRLEANIPWDDVKMIAKQTERIRNYEFLTEMKRSSGPAGDTDLPCYKVILLSKMEALKGKTPAQVLKENPQMEGELLKQAEFLRQNLARYPKNQEAIGAIEQAIALNREGKLKETQSLVRSVYQTEIKPLSSRKRNEKIFFYQIRITYALGQKVPINLEITNFFAEPQMSGNLKTPKQGTIEDQATMSISVDYPRWEREIDDLDRYVDNFILLNQGKNRNRALELGLFKSQLQ